MMIYLDHSATSFPKPERVINAVTEVMRKSGGNPGRGSYRLAREALVLMESTRKKLREFFNAPAVENVVFCLNATDAIYIALHGLLREGDEVITTDCEHNALARPLRHIERDGIIKRLVLRTGGKYCEPALVKKKLSPKTKLVALSQVSNVTGRVQPVFEIARVVHDKSDALLLVDGAQSAGHIQIDIQRDGIDLLALTGHKGLLGPMGTGALILSERAAESIQVVRSGGSGVLSETPFQPQALPYRLEAGTPNLPGIVGLCAALDLINEKGLKNIIAHEKALIVELKEKLNNIREIRLYGNDDGMPILSLNIADRTPATLSALLDEEFDIATRSGLHCAPDTHRSIGTFPDGTLRVSLGWSNTIEEVHAFLRAIRNITEVG